jgi:hypothetical protein
LILTLNISYAQQSLSVNDIFPRIPIDPMPQSPILIKFNHEDDDSCYDDEEDNDLVFGELEL